MKKLLLPIGVLFIVLCCCPYSPIAQYLVTDEPRVEDIVGIYELSALRVVDNNIEENPDSRIEILVDGNCKMIDFPIFIEGGPYGFKFKELFTGECTWNTTTYGIVRRGGETFPTWAVCFNSINFESTIKCADLVNDGNPYNLVFVFGDPDENDIISFAKIDSK